MRREENYGHLESALERQSHLVRGSALVEQLLGSLFSEPGLCSGDCGCLVCMLYMVVDEER